MSKPMTNKMEYYEIMWAEMSPDMYGGDNCDEVISGEGRLKSSIVRDRKGKQQEGAKA